MDPEASAALARLRELLRIPTVSYADESLIDWSNFDAFHAALERLYPGVHRVLEREVIGGHSLLYRWRGADAADPLVLMAHMDVVPVVASEWDHEPFAADLVGEGEEQTIHARGAVDDKGALVAILEAVEALVADGVTPAHDVYLSFGHNEETAGGGAQAIVAVLEARGIRPSLVLDEGGAVVDGVVPGVTVKTAMIGVAERGVMTVHLTAREQGGHASTPPADPATARLARAVLRLHRRPFPTRLVAPVRAMFETVAPYTRGPLQAVFRSIRYTGPALVKVFPKLGPELNALVRTTAVVTEMAGAAGANVLATTARATVNVRLLPGDTVASAHRRIRRVVADDGVDVELGHASEASPVSAWDGQAWGRLVAAGRATLGADVVATPYIQLGASDSRWFCAISDNVYRFTPFHLSLSEREALHSHNERIRVQVWLRGIEFYRALITG
ncbi:M20/M25/M40 family metallo-hydrolase [Microbacterium sp. ARD31]|uniref:M20/M25/M40 family metallo-hydrolase n=1 Tax=Microbacterium sp. ARD31 TaxID=2962576 RepID=UPI0028816549|nr:M20/M25/M40 family metallo-hydrolase [Microbacterium sp. ARD31]MDT0179425.1 M20/M25/M40 family metallo-hydrolase [Microbacterium sp. ARD31]